MQASRIGFSRLSLNAIATLMFLSVTALPAFAIRTVATKPHQPRFDSVICPYNDNACVISHVTATLEAARSQGIINLTEKAQYLAIMQNGLSLLPATQPAGISGKSVRQNVPNFSFGGSGSGGGGGGGDSPYYIFDPIELEDPFGPFDDIYPKTDFARWANLYSGTTSGGWGVSLDLGTETWDWGDGSEPETFYTLTLGFHR